MNKYLLVIKNVSGQWIEVSRLNRTCVFIADDDENAQTIVASYLKGKEKYYALGFLGRITGGLQIEEISVPDNVEVVDLSDKCEDEIFEFLFIGKAMIRQLQPFENSEAKEST